MSNALRAKITIVVTTTPTVGRNAGSVIAWNTCHSFAPSTRADSDTSIGIALSAAESTTRQNPVHTHTPTVIRATLFTAGATSHAIGWACLTVPNTSAFRAPT